MATNFINGILSQFSTNKKDCVYMTITPGVGLEVAEIDAGTNTVKQYGVKPLEYNESLKEIKDINALKEAISALFAELKIAPKSAVILSLPTVHMGKMELPIILEDDMVEEAIISEVEQSYIFKRCEPIVSWIEVPGNDNSGTRTTIYAAIQKPVVDAIKEAIISVGGTLERLEISLTTTLRALSYTGLVNSQISVPKPWTLMIVKSNGYELVQMNGSNVVDYYTEPLALKTYELEEIYDAIYASAQISLLNYPTNNLVILSETNMVSAEHLALKMRINGQIGFIENNEYKKQQFLPVSLDILPDLASKISLEAIGIAAINLYDFPLSFEFIKSNNALSTSIPPIKITFMGKEYLLTETDLQKLLAAIAVVLIVPSLILMFILSSGTKKTKLALDQINAQITKLNNEISELQENTNSTEFDINTEMENVIKNNRTKLIAYSALGETIPKKLWLKYYKTQDDGKIDIIGVSENVENVYVFYRNLKDSIIDSQLRLHKLEMESQSIDDAVSSSSNYTFEITNMAEDELGNPKETTDETADSENNSNQKNGNNKKAVADLEEVEVE